MTQVELLDAMERLLPGQFDDLLYRLSVPTKYLTQGSPQATRATEVLRYLEQQARIPQLQAALQADTPVSSSRPPPSLQAPLEAHTPVSSSRPRPSLPRAAALLMLGFLLGLAAYRSFLTHAGVTIIARGELDAVCLGRKGQSWNGAWQTLQQGGKGQLRGVLNLEVNAQGAVHGPFTTLAANPVEGAVEGKLDEVGQNVAGTWYNNVGEHGRFRLTISRTGGNFAGLYSMKDDQDPTNQANTWTGSKRIAR